MLPAVLRVKFLICLLSVCVCGGVRSRKKRYTKEEEKFIIDEVLSYPGVLKPIYGREMWIKIAENHSKMRISNPRNFPMDRTPNGLSLHFRHKLLKSKGKALLPNGLLEKFRLPHQRGQSDFPDDEHTHIIPEEYEGNKKGFFENRYTSTEDQFLIEILRSYPCKPIPVGGKKFWSDIAELFQKQREINSSEFPFERTRNSLRSRYYYLFKSKVKGEERKNFLEMIRSMEPKDNDMGPVKITYGAQKFTPEEDDFIIEQLLHSSCTHVYRRSLWREMEEKHDGKRQLETPGFLQKRSALSLRSRFQIIKKQSGSVPPELIEKFPQRFLNQPATPQGTLEVPSQHVNLQMEDEEDSEIWTSMLDELQNNSVDVNFNNI